MTVQSQVSRASYDGNGATVTFPVPFRFLDNSHVRVILRRPDGGEVPWAETTDYALAGAGQASGGTLTAVVPPAVGERLVILRNVPLTQEIDYIEGEPFPAGTHETGLDKLTMIAQQLNEQQNRVIALPPTDDTRVVLPTATARAGRYLAFDGDGNPVAAADPGNLQVVISPYMEQLLDTADAPSLRHEILPDFGQQDAGKVLMVDAGGADYVLAGPLTGFRNRIINGGLDIWQRGASQSNTGYGSVDRFRLDHTNGSTNTLSRQNFALGQTEVPGSPKHFMRCVVASGGQAASAAQIRQHIEDVRTLSGKKATLTFHARADAPRSIAVEFRQNFGTGGSPSPGVQGIGVQKFDLTTSWQRFDAVVDIPSIVGKTLGTNGNDSLQVVWWLDAGSDYDALTDGLGNQSGTFDFARLSLVKGDATREADPFEPRPLALELMLCQRYFQKSYPLGIAPGSFGSSVIEYGMLDIRSEHEHRDTLLMCVQFPVEMRASPAVTPYSYLTGEPGKAAIVGSSGFDFDAQTVGTSPIGFRIRPSESLGVAPVRVGYLWAADAEL
jgi:hypothetical protein